MGKKGFMFYESFYNAVQLIADPVERLEAMEAICRYGLYGEEVKIGLRLQIMMELVKPILDGNNRRAEGGKKGGRPAKAATEETIGFENETLGLQAETYAIYDKDKDKDKDKEGEYEGEESPSTPSTKALTAKQAQQMVADTGLPPAADQAIRDWLEYKKERRQGYKTTGLKTLLTIAKRNADLYGGDAIAELIQSSIAAQYQGITWDKLKGLPVKRCSAEMEML